MVEYTISIPQWDDVIKIRPDSTLSKEELKKVKRERFLRIKQSPSSDAQKKLTQILTYIDDTEDILSTALWLGRGAIRKIAPRFIPIVGWALLATDIMSLAQKIFSILPAGRAAKRGLGEVFDSNSFTKRGRTRSVERFMRRTPGFGTFLEAAQAMETITGYGLSLGGIMGVLTDSVWGAIRKAQGHQVKIRKGQTGDFLEKALTFHFTSAGMAFLGDDLTQEEHTKIILAHEMALDEIIENLHPDFNLDRQEIAGSQIMPQFLPWDPMTREIISSGGINPDRDESPMFADEGEKISIGEFGDRAFDATPRYLNTMKSVYGETRLATFTNMSTLETMKKQISWIAQETDPFIYSPSWEEKVFSQSIERGVMPPVNATPLQFSTWVENIAMYARGRGHSTPYKEDLVSGTIRTFGRWEENQPWTI